MHALLESAVDWTEVPAWLCFYGTIVVLLPLAIFRRLRAGVGSVVMFATIPMGLHVWLLSCLLTYDAWGLGTLIVGALFAGIGPLPMGVAALAFHWGAYDTAGLLLLSFVVIIGLRLAGAVFVASGGKHAEHLRATRRASKEVSCATSR